mgnify:CR=1 FL=1
MIRDLNIRKVMKNAFRITKTKYKTALRVRVPGGLIDPECLMLVSEISSKYGDGKILINYKSGKPLYEVEENNWYIYDEDGNKITSENETVTDIKKVN